MIYEKVTIKQIPDDLAALTGLNKYGRSKMPGTMDNFQVASFAGRAITGIDEDGWDVNRIEDSIEKEKAKKQKKELRETLQKAIGEDLSAISPFWDTFTVKISADSDLVLLNANPYDVIKYHVLIANGYVAPDKASASLPQFRSAKYYCHVEDRVNNEEVSTQKIRDRAASELLKLSDNDELMVLVGQYLEGDKYKNGMKNATLYKMLSSYIKDVTEPDNLKRFLKAVNLSPAELQFKIVTDRAVKKKKIKLVDGYYQVGQVTLGKTISEVYDALKTPEFAREFLLLKEEVEV